MYLYTPLFIIYYLLIITQLATPVYLLTLILTMLIKNRDIIIYYILHLSYLAMPKFDIHKIVINWSCSVNYLKVKKT